MVASLSCAELGTAQPHLVAVFTVTFPKLYHFLRVEVSVSKDGPWALVLDTELEDTMKQIGPRKFVVKTTTQPKG